jgi:hypothetical protein
MAVLVATSAVGIVRKGLVFFWDLTWQPVVFFQGHVGRPPSWYAALGGPLLCSCLTVVGYVGFTSHVNPLIARAVSASHVPASFVTSMQHMHVVSAASVCVVVWLVASAVMMAVEVLRAESASVVRLLEFNALAFYSQVPWLIAFVYAAWTYRSPLDAGGVDVLAAGAGVERLTRLMQEDPTLVIVRSVGECSTLWLHGLFGAGYLALAGVPLARAQLLALVVYGLPHVVRRLW